MRIAIAAPARSIKPKEIEYAIQWLQSLGMEPVYDERLFAVDHIFAGTAEHRTAVIQEYMDRDDINAIWLARGGYGSIHVIDRLDFTGFLDNPKPFIGFSDTTVFHGKMSRLGVPSFHAASPWLLENRSPEALWSLHKAIEGQPLRYEWPAHPLNRQGSAQGEIVGGNLSILCCMLGSDTFPETDHRILFVEEVDEYIYHVERMMFALKRAGKLSHLKALIVGGLTSIHDNAEPFGKTVEQAIFDVVKEYDYPVVFGFPAGHQPDNRTLVFGKEATLTVKDGVHFAQ